MLYWVWGVRIVDYDELLSVATAVGESLLENGAEIYRVEESVSRIVGAYGVQEVDVFAIPNCLITTVVRQDGKSLTKIKRILSRGTNLDRVNRLNDLCRRVCRDRPELSQVRRELEEILRRPVYGLAVKTLAYGITAFAFTLFFGGNFWDALCALLFGAAIKQVAFQMEKLHSNAFFVNTVCSALTAALAMLAVRLGLAANMDKMVIGTLMNLVPGVAITNSMRDIIAGDLVAGLTKMTEALLVATAMAVGAGLALSASHLLGGG